MSDGRRTTVAGELAAAATADKEDTHNVIQDQTEGDRVDIGTRGSSRDKDVDRDSHKGDIDTMTNGGGGGSVCDPEVLADDETEGDHEGLEDTDETGMLVGPPAVMMDEGLIDGSCVADFVVEGDGLGGLDASEIGREGGEEEEEEL